MVLRTIMPIFSLLKGAYSFWHHCIMVGVLQYIMWLEVDMIGNEAELRYQYSFGEKNCLTIIGKKLFATPWQLSFFF